MPFEAHEIVVRSARGILDEAQLARLTRELKEASGPASQRLVLDCSAVDDIAPRALAAMLEFGTTVERGTLALAGLSRRNTLVAVQVGLAEHWEVFASLQAARGESAAAAGRRAVIFELPEHLGVGALDLAGRPLLVRQLQTLRELGIEDVVVEVADGPQAWERAAWLLGSDPLFSRVIVIPSAKPLGVEELAGRVGLGPSEPFVAWPADIVLQAQIPVGDRPARYQLSPPTGVHDAPLEMSVRTRVRDATEAQPVPGWGARVTNHESAHALACAALEGKAAGMLVHAAEVRPGVWLARGARVSPDAQLVPPAFVGPDARVFARAQVGPRAIIGQAAVVEREAVVTDAALAPHTILGEGARVSGAFADFQGMVNFADGARSAVRDSLVLATRRAPKTALSSRLVAALLVGLLALPWLLGALARRLSGRPVMQALPSQHGRVHVGALGVPLIDLVPALLDVVLGRRDLVGISDRRAIEAASRGGHPSFRPGAFDLSAAMAPGASTATLLRMWRWYRAHKNAALDRTLWRQRAPEGREQT
jgi:hypothetical protein